MNLLILGSGGREHALAWKLSQSLLEPKIYVAPGNTGTAEVAENIDINPDDFRSIKKICISKKIEMLVVGPEDPLVKGIYDFFKEDNDLKHIMVIGPSKAAAQLEGSKSFAKAFMQRHNIPTAGYREFDVSSFSDGIVYIKQHALPIVLKADGLAAGKGVLICNNHIEALGEFELMIHQSKFGEAGEKVVVEEFLSGTEVSVFVLTDGKNYVLLPEAKDYKRIGEKDTGLNTGGMGAISPVPSVGGQFMQKIIDRVITPTIKGIQDEDLLYQGFIFIGIIKVNDEPLVIEYNCRMGDPETEAVLLRVKNDLVQLFIDTASGTLHEHQIDIDERAAATIVAVSGGYPGHFEKDKFVDLGYMESPDFMKYNERDGGVVIFHGGTKFDGSDIISSGGRVLAVSALADNLTEAIELSKEVLSHIYFEDMYYRRDIGYEFIK
ncbi:MAG: phosphoribosylamine--glycine ligase [Ginsengibacter sp.]